MHNRIELLGRVGSMRTTLTKHGVKFMYINVATHESRKNSKGEVSERTTWVAVHCYEKLADIVEKNLEVGDLIFVEGKLDLYERTYPNGYQRETLGVKCKRIYFLKDGMPSGVISNDE